MERFQVYISKPLMEQLKRIAQEKDLSVAEIIRRACEKYLEDLKKAR